MGLASQRGGGVAERELGRGGKEKNRGRGGGGYVRGGRSSSSRGV